MAWSRKTMNGRWGSWEAKGSFQTLEEPLHRDGAALQEDSSCPGPRGKVTHSTLSSAHCHHAKPTASESWKRSYQDLLCLLRSRLL